MMPLVLPRRLTGEGGLTRVYWEYGPSDEERAEVAAWIEEADDTDLEFLAIEQTAISMHGTRDGAHVMVAPRRCSNLTSDLNCALAELRHEIRR